MDRKTLNRLENLNQLRLTEDEKEATLKFFSKREKDMEALDKIDTENLERMVHVLPVSNVLRQDKVVQTVTREELQKSAPETDENYWCVPRVVE